MNIKKMLFSTLAALILLTSCSASTNRNPTGKSGEADAGNLADDYIILTMENQDALYLGKVNIHTGSLTPLCTDPVCNHFDMSCPMYGINPAFIQDGDILYFSREGGYDNIIERIGLFAYNLRTGEFEKLISCDKDKIDDFPDNFFKAGDYLFYYCDRMKEVASEEEVSIENRYFDIYRFDIKTGANEKIGDTTDFPIPFSAPVMLESDEQTIEWEMGNLVVSTDYDFNILKSEEIDLSNRVFEKGEYTYSVKTAADPDAAAVGAWDFYIIDSDGDEKLIMENMLSYIHLTDCIVYTKYIKDKCELLYSKDEVENLAEDYYDYINHDLYIVNVDGTDNRLLGTVEDPYIDNSHIYMFNNVSGCVHEKDGVCLALMSHMTPEERYDIETQTVYTVITPESLGGVVVINTETGDINVTYMNGEPYTPYRDISAELKK